MRNVSVTINPETDALIIVDLQNDFCPGGALPVAEGDDIVAPINVIMNRFRRVYATLDWHPEGHISFASTHGEDPFTLQKLDDGREQMLWPDHCVQYTTGAKLHSGLSRSLRFGASKIYKGDRINTDSYSGFRENVGPDGDRRSTGLADRLRADGIKRIFVCGLARDYCVQWTAKDGVDEGFDVFFLWDLTRPVDPESNDAARKDLEESGVTVLVSGDLF